MEGSRFEHILKIRWLRYLNCTEADIFHVDVLSVVLISHDLCANNEITLTIGNRDYVISFIALDFLNGHVVVWALIISGLQRSQLLSQFFLSFSNWIWLNQKELDLAIIDRMIKINLLYSFSVPQTKLVKIKFTSLHFLSFNLLLGQTVH